MCSLAEINECGGENGCHDNASCTNTIGSYNCSCYDGFEGNGTHCQGIPQVFIVSRMLRLHHGLFNLFVCLFLYLLIAGFAEPTDLNDRDMQ